MKIGAIVPWLGNTGGIRRFLELGNVFVKRGIDYTLFVDEGQDCPWFECNFPIKNWFEIEADFILIADPPSFRILPRVRGKVFIYVIAGGHFLRAYQMEYGRYPFILNSRIFAKYFPNSYLVEGGVNTEHFKPKKRKVLFYDNERTAKGSNYIRKELSGIDSVELVGLKDLNNEELQKAYQEGDYLVDADAREGWGNMAAEAIASGLTVVTIGRNCEPFSNRVIMVRDLREFFTNPMKEFSWEKVCNKLLQIFANEG